VISGGFVHVVASKADEINMQQFTSRLAYWADPDTARSKNPPAIRISEAALSHIDFTFTDERREPLPVAFDYFHFTLSGITGVLKDFRAKGDTLEFKTKRLVAEERKSKFKIHRLATTFRLTRHSIALEPLQLWAGHSFLADSLRFGFAKQSDMGSIIDKVEIRLKLEKSRLDYRDIGLFNETIASRSDSIRVSGLFTGRVNNAKLDNFKIAFGHGSTAKGSMTMKGLPNVDSTFFGIHLENSKILPADLGQYTPVSSHHIWPNWVLQL